MTHSPSTAATAPSTRLDPWDAARERFACDCSVRTLTIFTAANLVRHARLQCVQCGMFVAAKKEDCPPDELAAAPPFDTDLQKQWNDAKYAFARELHQEATAEIQAESRLEWDARHAAATSGPEWEERRRLVFKRCCGICEGCGTARAQIVHHLTYTHLGRELLFQLAGLCRDCHDVAHDRDHSAEDARC